MKKKPLIAQEAAAPYTAKKPAKGGTARRADVSSVGIPDVDFQKVAVKIFAERKDLLRTLAQ